MRLDFSDKKNKHINRPFMSEKSDEDMNMDSEEE